MSRVLVTCGEQRASLACVRALGRHHEVHVASASGRSLAGASRYAVADWKTSDPLASPGEYRRAVADVVRGQAIDVVLPMTEPAVLAVLSQPDDLGGALVPFPQLDAFLRASDKMFVADAAKGVGLAVPSQVTVAGVAEGVVALPQWATTPTVLKPARSVQQGRKLAVSYVAVGDDMHDALRHLPSEAFPLMVQQRIEGPGSGVFLLRWHGTTRAAFAHRRIREKPPSGGVSVLRESVPLDAELRARTEALLDRLDWSGVAMVEFKVDAATGVPYVMEINARFWGSLQLAIDAGVDFPNLLLEAALGQPARPMPSYRVGTRSRWTLGDVDHLLLRLFRSRAALDLPPDAPGRLATIGGFLRAFLPPNRSEISRLTDPRPFARELMGWMGALIRRPPRS